MFGSHARVVWGVGHVFDKLMKKTLYDILGLQAHASPADIEMAYRMALDKTAPLVAQGDRDAANLQRAQKDAFDILSDPVKRTQYDQSLVSAYQTAGVPGRPAGGGPGHTLWGNKLLWVGLGVLLLLLAFYVNDTRQKEQALLALKQAEQAAKAEADRLRIENERMLIQGALHNQARATDAAYSSQDRGLQIQDRMEDRRQRQLEHEAALANRALQLSQEREHRQARAQEDAEKRQQAYAARSAEREAAYRNQREQRYWACMNEALNRMTSERANARCVGLR